MPTKAKASIKCIKINKMKYIALSLPKACLDALPTIQLAKNFTRLITNMIINTNFDQFILGVLD